MTGDGIIEIHVRGMCEVFICKLSNFVTLVTTGRALSPDVKSLILLRYRGNNVISGKENSAVKYNILKKRLDAMVLEFYYVSGSVHLFN